MATNVLGDVNDDVLSDGGSPVGNFMLPHGYTQLVKHATTDRATLIDHDDVYCSVPLSIL